MRRRFEIFIAIFIFALVLALYPYTGNPTNDIKNFLSAWAACIIGGGWFFSAWYYKIPVRRPRALWFPIVGLIALYAISTLLSPLRAIGVLETSRLIVLGTFYYVASQVYTTPGAVRRLLKVLVLASFVGTLYGFLQAGGFDPVPWDPGDKKTDLYTGLPAAYGNPNFAAHVMVLTLPIAIYLFFTERAWFWGVAAGALAVHLGMTGQRASYIAFAGAATLAGVTWVMLRSAKQPFFTTVKALGAWALLGVFGLAAGMGLLSWKTGSPLPLDTSLHIRYWSYISATDMIRHAPLLGSGPGVYGHKYHEYWTQLEKEWFVQETRKNEHVHNDLMEIAIDAGVPAAGLYLLLLVLAMGYSIAWAVRAGPGERALGLLLTALFAGFFIDGLFGFNFRVPVSAAFAMLLLGALEGLVGRPAPEGADRQWTGFATFATTVLTVIALLATCVFTSEFNLFYAEREIRANSLNAARIHLRDGESLAPWNAQFALNQSKALYRGGDLEGALTELQRMFTIDPDYFPARLTEGRYHILLAQQALAKNPKDIAKPLEHLDAAAEDAREVLRVCGHHPAARKMLGRAAAARAIAMTTADKVNGAKEAKPYWESAEKDLEEATRSAADEKDDMYRMLAQVKLALGKPNEAEMAFERAAKEDPAVPATWAQFLAFANGNRRYERIRNTLVAVTGRLSAEAEPRKDVLTLVRMCLANVHENGYADLDRAEKEYGEAAALTPLSPEVWSNFARFAFQYSRQASLKEALRQAQQTLVKEKTDIPPQLRVVFATLQGGPKALEEASSVLVAQVRSYPADSKISAQQAYEWTAHLLREAVELRPVEEQGITRLNLGIVYAQFKNFTLADQLFASAQGHLPGELVPKHAAMWSETLVELNRGADAITLIEPLRAQYATDFDLRHAYARALAKSGRMPEAREEYTKLLAEPDLGAEGRAVLQQEADALR